MGNSGVVFVVDVEVDIVKELLLTTLGLLNNEMRELGSDIYSLEFHQKDIKFQLKNCYSNLNSAKCLSSHNSRLHKVNSVCLLRTNIAELQNKLNHNKGELTYLYKQKYDLKQRIIKYNALADLYQIKLYK